METPIEMKSRGKTSFALFAHHRDTEDTEKKRKDKNEK